MPTVISKPLRMRNPVAVTSTSLAHVAYDDRRAILQVDFRDGTTYQYAGVPLETYHDLLRADSKGVYFNHHIRSRFRHAVLQVEAPDAHQLT
jgi:KTSC domain